MSFERTGKVPIVDVGPLFTSSMKDKVALAEQVDAICRSDGFFYVTNHGISPADLRAPFDAAERFFDLPLEKKMAVAMANTTCYSGYLPVMERINDPALKGNYHEAFQFFGENSVTQRPSASLGGGNLWPEDLDDFRQPLLRHYAQLNELGDALASVFELALRLQPGTLRSFFKVPLTFLRLLKYPSQEASASESGEIGIRPHTDNGAFTILQQDAVGGLQLINSDGSWLDVPPIEGTFVINLGEMMKRWSDGIYHATPHRVINRSGRERYSVPFFMLPDYDAMVIPLVKNPSEFHEPVMHNTLAKDEYLTCGEILTRTWSRIYPSA